VVGAVHRLGERAVEMNRELIVQPTARTCSQTCWWLYGWMFIRPLRWMSRQSVRGSFGLRLKPEKSWDGWRGPNLHLWLWYKTYGKFFLWMEGYAWRNFCDWTGGSRRTYPLIARVIHKVGRTMSYGLRGGECFHCASEAGDQVELASGDEHFKCIDSWTCSTQDGTDHRFRGITTCPRCGHQAEYEDGSL
jgi:hypothetical protein